LTGGTGSGATANITVNSSGAVSAVSLSNRGTGYAVNDTLSAAIPGGSGFSVPVSVVSAQSGSSNSWLSELSRTISGSVYINNSPGTISPNELYIGADTVDTNNQGLHIVDIEDAPTTGFTGGRIGVHGFITVQGVPASTPGSGLTGVQGNTTINA